MLWQVHGQTSWDEQKNEAMKEILLLAKDKSQAQIMLLEVRNACTHFLCLIFTTLLFE